MCSLRKIVQSAVNEAHAIVKYQLAGQEENVKRLKTAFSAVLALSMALGMVVVPAGAADFFGAPAPHGFFIGEELYYEFV